MLRRLEPDQLPFNVMILQQMGQIIKQSTNILAQNVEKKYDDQRHEMMVNINEVFEREVSKMRQQNLNSIFDTWNYLSEIKISLKDILTSLTIQTRQSSENLKTKVGNCQELVLQLQVNLCQKLFFLQNMRRTYILCTKIVLNVRNNFCGLPGLSLEFSCTY